MMWEQGGRAMKWHRSGMGDSIAKVDSMQHILRSMGGANWCDFYVDDCMELQESHDVAWY